MPRAGGSRYLPSVGVSLSVAALLAALLGHTSYHLRRVPRLAAVAKRVPRWAATALRVALLAAALAAVAFCVRRTVERTQDWRTDETLFMSALDVCPTSAKHHYQVGLVRASRVPPPPVPGLTGVPPASSCRHCRRSSA